MSEIQFEIRFSYRKETKKSVKMIFVCVEILRKI